MCPQSLKGCRGLFWYAEALGLLFTGRKGPRPNSENQECPDTFVHTVWFIKNVKLASQQMYFLFRSSYYDLIKILIKNEVKKFQ